MLQKYEGIVLYTVKYSDKSDIVHVYTRQGGRMSFLLPVRRSRQSAVRQVLFQPLSILGIEADIRPRSSLHPIKETRASYVFRSLPYHPYKSAIALFVAEFLYRVVREEMPNELLYHYLASSIEWLDVCEKDFANFHLVFLMRLSRFLGLYPNLEDYSPCCYFDLLDACFVSRPPSHGFYVLPEEASRIRTLARMNYDTMYLFRMTRADRNHCLDVICTYYRLHLPDFNELKSLPVLQELF